MKQHAADIILILGGFLLAGVRNVIGKWLVTTTLSVLNRLVKNTEHYVIIWLRKREHRHHRVPQDCVKGVCADV